MTAKTWRQITDKLAERMYYHAYCPESGHEPGKGKECPFCADIQAYEAYTVKKAQMKDSNPEAFDNSSVTRDVEH